MGTAQRALLARLWGAPELAGLHKGTPFAHASLAAAWRFCSPAAGPHPAAARRSRPPARLLQRLGLQEELPKLSVIHVAGTKGKGSTCAVVERVLREAGYRTGLYTSPHLIDVRERIRING